MLEAILQHVKQMGSEEFYAFCSELYYSGASGVFYDEPADPKERPKFIGRLAEIVEMVGGKEDGNG